MVLACFAMPCGALTAAWNATRDCTSCASETRASWFPNSWKRQETEFFSEKEPKNRGKQGKEGKGERNRENGGERRKPQENGGKRGGTGGGGGKLGAGWTMEMARVIACSMCYLYVWLPIPPPLHHVFRLSRSALKGAWQLRGRWLSSTR